MVDKLILKTNKAFTSFIQGLILFVAVISFTSFLVDSVPVQAAVCPKEPGYKSCADEQAAVDKAYAEYDAINKEPPSPNRNERIEGANVRVFKANEKLTEAVDQAQKAIKAAKNNTGTTATPAINNGTGNTQGGANNTITNNTNTATTTTPTTTATPAAQTGDVSGLLALSSCTSGSSNTPVTGGGAANLINCFKQVSTVAIIVGIILGGIMTAVDVLTSYVPGQSVNAGVNMQKRITSLITGIVLIAMPGAILNLFNPATTNIDFLGRLKDLTRQKPPDPVVTTPTTTPVKTNPDGTPVKTDPKKPADPNPNKSIIADKDIIFKPKGMIAKPATINGVKLTVEQYKQLDENKPGYNTCSWVTVTSTDNGTYTFQACSIYKAESDNAFKSYYSYDCLKSPYEKVIPSQFTGGENNIISSLALNNVMDCKISAGTSYYNTQK